MKHASLAAVAATCLLTFSTVSQSHAAASCWQPFEVEAARVRDLQTLLMMTTLKCGSAGSAIEAQYNSFVAKKKTLLVSHNNVLKARFMRENGIGQGQAAYDSFTTGLANSHSSRAQSAHFCEMGGTLLTLAEGSTEDELSTLARSFSETTAGVGDACPLNAPAPEPVPAVIAAVTSSDPVQPAAAPATPAGEQAATPQSAADALAAAALAMQAAASAMKAEQAQLGAASSKPVQPRQAGGTPLEVVKDAPVVAPVPTEL
jgi:hypothetical protein